MRSSKSRSRGNKNRNNRPAGGNIINRVFDSSGPDGKVRGTPQQIIDKYSQLHRDAQLSGDRVAAENFAQHAEHYLRLLATAQKEMEKAREEQEEANRQRQAERDRERNARLKAQEDASNGGSQPQPDAGDGPQPDVVEAEDNSGLVDTPEGKSEAPAEAEATPAKPRRARRPRKSAAGDDGPKAEPSEAAE